MEIEISELKRTGKFEFYRFTVNKKDGITLKLENSNLLKKIEKSRYNTFPVGLCLTEKNIQEIRDFEENLKKTLNTNEYIESTIKKDKFIWGKLWIVRKQIVTVFKNKENDNCTCYDCPIGGNLTVEIEADSIWKSQKEPNKFTYNWKVKSVLVN